MRIASMLALLGLLAAGPVQAQEMSFQPDEEAAPAAAPAVPTPSTAPPVPGAPAPSAAGLPRAVVLIIRSGAAEPELAHALTESLSRQVLASGKVEVMPSEEFQVQLFAPGERAAQDCATNAVCLSGYGKELWLDKLVVGVLYKGEGGYNLNVDLVGVENAEVEQYANRDFPNLARMSTEELDKQTGAMVFKLFGLRDPSLESEGPRKRLVAKASPVQTALAYSAAGVAGVALVTGLVLGAQARSIGSELDSNDDLTMREASDKIDQGESKARGAYVAFAASGVMLATAAALFLIKPMQEEEVQAAPPTRGFDRSSSWTPFVVPGAGTAEAGVSLGLRF